MHIGDFLAIGNGYAGDGNHPRMPFMPAGRKPGKSLSWVDTSVSLVPRRDDCDRYGMRGYDEW